jgi:hypothetical protein
MNTGNGLNTTPGAYLWTIYSQWDKSPHTPRKRLPTAPGVFFIPTGGVYNDTIPHRGTAFYFTIITHPLAF